MMQVLIIEDEPLAVEKLVKFLSDYDATIVVADTLASIETAVVWLKTNPLPDLILLDIHLADGLCFDIFKQVEVKCPVIFCTAYDQYALKAFQLHSIDYLLKPIQYAKLEQSLNKMKDMQNKKSPEVSNQEIKDMISLMKNQDRAFKSRFLIKLGTKIRTIKTCEIAYFHSHDKLNLLVTKEGDLYPVDYSLDDLIQLLDPSLFFHINRKLVIHIDAVKEIHSYFKGRLKLVLNPGLDEEIIVSSQRTPLFKTWLDQ
jgi:two-component system LytT family response regulator